MKTFLILSVLPCALLCSSEVANEAKRPCRTVISIDVPHTPRSWFKREMRQVSDVGPFWANRGKKDPRYSLSELYAEEPHWLYIRRDNESFDSDLDPFFTTRGKKCGNTPFFDKLMERFGRRKEVGQYKPK